MNREKIYAVLAAAVLTLSSVIPACAAETEQEVLTENDSDDIVVITRNTIKNVQQALLKKGYDCKGIDGTVGERTSAQIRKYQEDHHLSASGEVDDGLLDSLKVKKETKKIKDTDYKHYKDDSLEIQIDKLWYDDTNVYIAHIQMTDFSRFHSTTTSGTAEDVDDDNKAVLTVNGDYGTACGYPNIRDGSVVNGGSLSAEACYRTDGLLVYGQSSSGGAGMSAQAAAGAGIKDTFQFGPAFLVGGQSRCSEGGDRAQRTAIGTTGDPGDICLLVSSGRGVDGESDGLTYSDCVHILQDYGCTFGAPLDGGGSSVMIFQGETLVGDMREGLIDFIFVK